MLHSEQQQGLRYVLNQDSNRGIPKKTLSNGDDRQKDCRNKQQSEDGDSDRSSTDKRDDNSPGMSEVTLVGVVGSPEVFGNADGRDSNLITAAAERLIERCDQLNRTGDSSQGNDQLRARQRHEMMGQQGGDNISIPGMDLSRPARKRYGQQTEEPRFIAPQIQLMPSQFIELQFPSCGHFQHAMNQWDWASIDNTKIPVILRGNEKFAAVHIIQLKLLSKFPPIYPPESKTHGMTAHKMTLIESWIFNSINAVICKFDFGYQLFTTDDEIVRLAEADRFYWCVKVYNLNRMIDLYHRQMHLIKTTHLTATITRVKDYVEADLQNAEKEYQRSQLFINAHGTNGQPPVLQTPR